MMATGNPSVEFDDVCVSFSGREILSDITLALSAPRTAIIGANGSGKSTFVRLLNGLVAPTSGRITINGIDVGRDPRSARRMVSMVFSNPDHQALMPTVQEDVAFSLRGSGMSKAEAEERVEECLRSFGLWHLRAAAIHTLSGGERQLVALAAVSIRKAEVLIADEPTALLDLPNTQRIETILLDSLAPKVLLVTHDLELAQRCDTAVLIHGGRVVETGAPAEVIRSYRHNVAC